MKEPKTIFGKIIAALLSVFINNWQSFAEKLWKKIPEDLQDKFTLGVKIVENLKSWVGGPVGAFIVHVIPGDVDEKIREQLIKILHSKFVNQAINTVDEPYVGNFLGPDEKLWHTIASDLNKEITGVSYGQSAITTEVAYQNFKKNK